MFRAIVLTGTTGGAYTYSWADSSNLGQLIWQYLAGCSNYRRLLGLLFRQGQVISHNVCHPATVAEAQIFGFFLNPSEDIQPPRTNIAASSAVTGVHAGG